MKSVVHNYLKNLLFNRLLTYGNDNSSYSNDNSNTFKTLENIINEEYINQCKSDIKWETSYFKNINFLKANNVGKIGEQVFQYLCEQCNIKCKIDGNSTRGTGHDGFILIYSNSYSIQIKTARVGKSNTFQHELGDNPWKSNFLIFIDIDYNDFYLTIMKNFDENHYLNVRNSKPYFSKSITKRNRNNNINTGAYKLTLSLTDLKSSYFTFSVKNKNYLEIKNYILKSIEN